MLTAERAGNRPTVVQACEASLRAGVRPGMSVAHAQALLPGGAVVHPHEPQRLDAALRALVRWALRFTPIVRPDPPDGLLLEVSGCEHLHGGTRRMFDRVVRQVRQLGLRVRGGIGPTAGCAWALARFGRPGTIVESPDAVPEALAPLPVRALRVDGRIAEALRAVAVESIGQLMALPRASLAERFGGSLLLRLDQATGQAFEAVEPIRLSEPVRAERVFAGPVTRLEAVVRAGRDLVDRLCEQLAQREAGARRLRIEFERIDTRNLHEPLMLSRPSRDARHLWALLRPKLERVHMGFGVERMALHAVRTGRLPHRQSSAEGWCDEGGTPQHDRRIGSLVDQYAARLGADRVSVIEVSQTHVPEQVFAHRPFEDTQAGHRRMTEVVDADRPTLLCDRPEPVGVVLLSPDGPVISMNRGGESLRIVRGVGPERITPRWWLVGDDRRKPPPRDYFKVQDERGRWWWLYRRADTASWFVHGRWC